MGEEKYILDNITLLCLKRLYTAMVSHNAGVLLSNLQQLIRGHDVNTLMSVIRDATALLTSHSAMSDLL